MFFMCTCIFAIVKISVYVNVIEIRVQVTGGPLFCSLVMSMLEG